VVRATSSPKFNQSFSFKIKANAEDTLVVITKFYYELLLWDGVFVAFTKCSGFVLLLLFFLYNYSSLSLSLVPWFFFSFFSFFFFFFRSSSSFVLLQKMKVIESRPNGPSTVFGLVVLPLNSKHTAGCAVALNISDEFMNIKGSLQLAAKWEVALPLPPRQVLVELMSANDLPTRSNVSHVACRVRNKRNETQVGFIFFKVTILSF
jgi:hypothetical protein